MISKCRAGRGRPRESLTQLIKRDTVRGGKVIAAGAVSRGKSIRVTVCRYATLRRPGWRDGGTRSACRGGSRRRGGRCRRRGRAA